MIGGNIWPVAGWALLARLLSQLTKAIDLGKALDPLTPDTDAFIQAGRQKLTQHLLLLFKSLSSSKRRGNAALLLSLQVKSDKELEKMGVEAFGAIEVLVVQMQE